MSDVNPNVSGEVTETEAPVIDEKAKGSAELNAAIANHTKRLEKKFEQKFEAILAALKPADAATSAEPKPADGKAVDPEVAELKKQVAAMAKREQAALAEARQQKVSTTIANTIGSKIAPDYSKLILKEANSLVQFDRAGVPFIELNGEAHGIEDGLEIWLTENKSYQAPPKAAQRNNQFNRPNPTTQPQPASYLLPPANEEERLIREMGDAIQAGGLKPIAYR